MLNGEKISITELISRLNPREHLLTPNKRYLLYLAREYVNGVPTREILDELPIVANVEGYELTDFNYKKL